MNCNDLADLVIVLILLGQLSRNIRVSGKWNVYNYIIYNIYDYIYIYICISTRYPHDSWCPHWLLVNRLIFPIYSIRTSRQMIQVHDSIWPHVWVIAYHSPCHLDTNVGRFIFYWCTSYWYTQPRFRGTHLRMTNQLPHISAVAVLVSIATIVLVVCCCCVYCCQFYGRYGGFLHLIVRTVLQHHLN